MGAQIGFVVLSHSQPEVLKRLLSTLDRTYRNPPIVVHHDFSQCSLPNDASDWSTDLQYVRPYIRTEWARISIPEAFLAALAMLYSTRAPDWFVLLSASDYPALAGSSVIRELTTGNADLYMDYQFVDRAPLVLEPELPPIYLGVGKEKWRQIVNERYIMTPNPFSEDLRCCAGDFWLTGNARVASKLNDAPVRYPDLFKYYFTSFCPDESICHTILGNDPDLRIVKNNKRYTSWPDMGAHPNTLQLSDFDAIIRSGCHFTRKCLPPVSDDLLDKLDRIAVWR